MLFASLLALAGSPTLDAAQICASEQRVVLAPDLVRRFQTRGPCASVVPAESVANYMKAFALLTRELAELDIAAQLVRHMEARWLLVREGSGVRVFDAEAGDFVDTAAFVAAAAGKPLTEAQRAAAAAYQQGYRALREKRYDDARAKLGECLQHDPEHAGCHWELGWVHWVAEDWAAAASSWGEVEKHQPDYPELGSWLGKARGKAKASR